MNQNGNVSQGANGHLPLPQFLFYFSDTKWFSIRTLG